MTGRIVKGALIGFGVLSAVSVILAVIGGGL
jgi:hypothetical protein